MADQITLWLEQEGPFVKVLCSDPPGSREGLEMTEGEIQALRDKATHVVQIPGAKGNYIGNLVQVPDA